jgi:hypothetical protein
MLPRNEQSIFSLTWHRVILDEGEVLEYIATLSITNDDSSYYTEPAKSTSPSLLPSSFDKAMGSYWNSNPKQAYRFRQYC